MAAMVRIYADFNDRCADDGDVCWNLHIDDQRLETQSQLDKLGLKDGDKVILYQDEDEFEVIAALEWRFVDVLDKTALVAVTDPSTFRYFPDRYSDNGE